MVVYSTKIFDTCIALEGIDFEEIYSEEEIYLLYSCVVSMWINAPIPNLPGCCCSEDGACSSMLAVSVIAW